MKDSPMKNTSYWKSKHSDSSDASALKFKEGGYTSASPCKEPISIAIGLASMYAAHKRAKKAKYEQGMSAAGSKASAGATMSQGISAGPKGGMK